MKPFRKTVKMILISFLILFVSSCEKDLNSEPENPQLKLISPGTGTEWKAGAECLIKWENNSGEPVTIDLLQNDDFYMNIGTFAHLMTEYSFTLPDSITPASEYSVELYVTEKPETAIRSNKFLIKEKDNVPPTCKIVDPKDGKYIMTGDLVQITVEANDPDGSITIIKFFIDGVYTGQIPKTAFVFPWETLDAPIGLHCITALAVDNDGAESLISKVNVVITDGLSPIELVMIPAGSFSMGSMLGDYDEKPVNSVYITHNFYMGKYEISNEQYAEMLNYALSEGELTGDYQNNVTVKNLKGTQKELLDLNDDDCEIIFNGTKFITEAGKENRPAIELTWWGAAFYCNMLSRQVNVNELYELTWWNCNLNGTGFRLPTEAEWEYTAKYQDGRQYPWGNTQPDSTMCNYGKLNDSTTDVGAYSPQGDTSLGICDMSGNAWEWCNDWYNYYSVLSSILIDPSGPTSGDQKILRGGNINSSDYNIRTTYRNMYNLYSGYSFGMRVVLSIR